MNLFIDLCGVAVLCCSLLFIYSICMVAWDDGISFEKIAMFSFISLLISTALYVGLLPFYDHSESTPVTFMESMTTEDYGRMNGKNVIYELNRKTTPIDFNFSKETIPSELNHDSYYKPVENKWTQN